MRIDNLLVHLHNTVDAFTFKSRHIERIRETLPDVRITIASGNHDFVEKLPDAECALVWVFKTEWYETALKLKALFTPAAGHDWVARDPSGRVKTFFGSFHGHIMRESLLSMMLYFNRHIEKSRTDQKDRAWGRLDYSKSVTLFSQRVLIVGYGSLGRSMAGLLQAFGARVTGVKRHISEGDITEADKMITFDMLEDELRSADHIVFVLPGGPETDGILTARHFNAMKPGAYVYNLGRGNCYQEADLLMALKNGIVAGAGLDVFAEEPLSPSSPLWEQPNVLITPHSSAISTEYIDLFMDEWLETLIKI
jgi:phosphoglycerate dehydrogenase-like enzyme